MTFHHFKFGGGSEVSRNSADGEAEDLMFAEPHLPSPEEKSKKKDKLEAQIKKTIKELGPKNPILTKLLEEFRASKEIVSDETLIAVEDFFGALASIQVIEIHEEN